MNAHEGIDKYHVGIGDTHLNAHVASIDNTQVNGHTGVNTLENANNAHVNEHVGIGDTHTFDSIHVGIDNTHVAIGNTHTNAHVGIDNTHVAIGNTHMNANVGVGNTHAKGIDNTNSTAHIGINNTPVNAYVGIAEDAHVRTYNANVQSHKAHTNTNDPHDLTINGAHGSLDNLPSSTPSTMGPLMNLRSRILHLLCNCGEPIPLASLPYVYHNTFRIPITHHLPNHAFIQVLHQLKDLLTIYRYASSAFS